MKTLPLAAGAMLIAAYHSGCASSEHHLVLAPIGPAPTHMEAALTGQGALVVCSAYKVNADFNARDLNRPEYSDYKIYTADGVLFKNVHNNNGTILQEPKPVSLPAGRYSILARANGYGFVSVPVVIKARQETVLHLEGGTYGSPASASDHTNMVSLPDGRLVGWRAD